MSHERMRGVGGCDRCSVCGRCGLVVSLFVLHAGFAAWIGATNAPSLDEAGHLAAGSAALRSGSFDLYSVNPPLVRLSAALPVVFACRIPELGPLLRARDNMPGESRPEWSIGVGFVRDNAERARCLFTWARWACLPLSVSARHGHS